MDANAKCLKFPDLAPPAEALVKSLLAKASVSHNRAGDEAVVSYRIADALTQITPIGKWILAARFPVNGSAPETYERIASRLNLFPDNDFEIELLEKFGIKVISASDVQTLEAEALQALRPRPTIKPGNAKRRFAIVSNAA